MSLFKSREVRLSIPDPCQEDWGQMDTSSGHRFCGKCQSSVIDFSRLTRKQAVRAIKSAEGRVCGRLVRDSHGEVIFRSEPLGLVARVAGLSLVGIAGAAAQSACELHVKVTDPAGAEISAANVSIRSPYSIAPKALSEIGWTGTYSANLPPGSYQLDIQLPGFQRYRKDIVTVTCDDAIVNEVAAELSVGSIGGVMIDDAPSPVKNFFRRLFRYHR